MRLFFTRALGDRVAAAGGVRDLADNTHNDKVDTGNLGAPRAAATACESTCDAHVTDTDTGHTGELCTSVS